LQSFAEGWHCWDELLALVSREEGVVTLGLNESKSARVYVREREV
jgi:hypothetical protein